MMSHGNFSNDDLSSSNFDTFSSSRGLSFNRQLMQIEDEEDTLKSKIQTLETDIEDIDTSVRTITEMAYANENIGLNPSEIDDVLHLRNTILAGCEEEIEVSRKKLWKLGRMRDDLYDQRHRSSY